jgi:hypothetical protein
VGDWKHKMAEQQNPHGTQAPSPHEVREQLAEAGDVRGLLEHICQQPWTTLDRRDAFAQLRRAIDAASRRDPAGFCDSVFQSMLATASYAVFRVQYLVLQGCYQSDHAASARPPSPPVDAVNLQTQLVEVQRHAAEIAQAWASTSRLWALARQRELENDRAQRRPTGLREPRSSRARSANGKRSANGVNGRANRVLGNGHD